MANLNSIIKKIDGLKKPTVEEVMDLMAALEEARKAESDRLDAEREKMDAAVQEAHLKLTETPTKEEYETDARGTDLAALAVDVGAPNKKSAR